MKIAWTVFEKFEYFIERPGEKKNKKRYDCISSRKMFPTPKMKNLGGGCGCGVAVAVTVAAAGTRGEVGHGGS